MLRGTRTSNTTLLHVLRCAAENAVNHRVERCRAPARHADTPGCDLFRLLPGYVGDGVAPNDMVINIEHDVSRNPHLRIVEGAQDGCAHHAQHRPHVLRILNGLEERAHRCIVIEPRERDKDFVFTHAATYTASDMAKQSGNVLVCKLASWLDADRGRNLLPRRARSPKSLINIRRRFTTQLSEPQRDPRHELISCARFVPQLSGFWWV